MSLRLWFSASFAQGREVLVKRGTSLRRLRKGSSYASSKGSIKL